MRMHLYYTFYKYIKYSNEILFKVSLALRHAEILRTVSKLFFSITQHRDI